MRHSLLASASTDESPSLPSAASRKQSRHLTRRSSAVAICSSFAKASASLPAYRVETLRTGGGAAMSYKIVTQYQHHFNKSRQRIVRGCILAKAAMVGKLKVGSRKPSPRDHRSGDPFDQVERRTVEFATRWFFRFWLNRRRVQIHHRRHNQEFRSLDLKLIGLGRRFIGVHERFN